MNTIWDNWTILFKEYMHCAQYDSNTGMWEQNSSQNRSMGKNSILFTPSKPNSSRQALLRGQTPREGVQYNTETSSDRTIMAHSPFFSLGSSMYLFKDPVCYDRKHCIREVFRTVGDSGKARKSNRKL